MLVAAFVILGVVVLLGSVLAVLHLRVEEAMTTPQAPDFYTIDELRRCNVPDGHAVGIVKVFDDNAGSESTVVGLWIALKNAGISNVFPDERPASN